MLARAFCWQRVALLLGTDDLQQTIIAGLGFNLSHHKPLRNVLALARGRCYSTNDDMVEGLLCGVDICVKAFAKPPISAPR